MSTAESFDDLGAHFELTTANGGEKAYRKAVDHLTQLMVEDNAIGIVTVKKKKVIRRKSPPQSTNTRQTTTASGVKLKSILKAAQGRFFTLRSWTPPVLISMQTRPLKKFSTSI